jgi:MFS transporter, YNFM family, putative membrane transport protein
MSDTPAVSEISARPAQDHTRTISRSTRFNEQATGARQGTAAYRRISGALFLAGFATFSLLYCTQPLLPVFARDFHVSPATSSLALSLSTGFLAIAILGAAVVSEAIGRRGLMFASMTGAALLNLATAAMPGWHFLLLCRAAEGFVLGGVPAVAMAYLAEEVDRESLGLSMGLYVAGTALGGMAGRVGAGILADWLSWHAALQIIGLIGLVTSITFVVLLPASLNFARQSGFHPRYHLRAWWQHLSDRGLPFLFAIGFLTMGAFVIVYNYAGFRLVAPPYGLDQSTIGLIFMVYAFGIVASSIAGAAADRIGRRRVLPVGFGIAIAGTALTVADNLLVIVSGIVLLTIGFFITHSVASGWVGRLALNAKGHASSLYLLAYYLGSSIGGTAGGPFWSAGGWQAVAGLAGICLLLGLAASLRLAAILGTIPDQGTPL